MVLLLLFVLCRCIDTFICFITHKSVDSDLLLYGFPVDYDLWLYMSSDIGHCGVNIIAHL